jgi:hypothetical protein
MLVCVFFATFAREIAGAARIRSSLRPSWDRLRPLLFGANDLQTSGAARRDIAAPCPIGCLKVKSALGWREAGELRFTNERERCVEG